MPLKWKKLLLNFSMGFCTLDGRRQRWESNNIAKNGITVSEFFWLFVYADFEGISASAKSSNVARILSRSGPIQIQESPRSSSIVTAATTCFTARTQTLTVLTLALIYR